MNYFIMTTTLAANMKIVDSSFCETKHKFHNKQETICLKNMAFTKQVIRKHNKNKTNFAPQMRHTRKKTQR